MIVLDDSMNSKADSSAASSSISVIGFVKAPGRYSYRKGMTVEDALDEAQGYDTCDSCQAFWEERRGRGHSTYDKAPKLKREGPRLKLPEERLEWTRFSLEPGDEIEFRHVTF
jgi:protein involved in polysaccharide export with SLBB domain